MKKLDPIPDLNQEEVKMPWQKEVAKDWYEDYQKEKEENEKLRKELVELKKEIEKLKEKLKKLNQRTSENSSQPPSSDDYKKKFAKTFGQKGKKRGPKYDHVGKTRNGFGRVDEIVDLRMEKCPKCGASVEKQKETIIKKNLPVNNSLIAFPVKRDDKTSVITSDIINEKFTASYILVYDL
jgi:DNA repair exonuclease SbcCD ATPase subunit